MKLEELKSAKPYQISMLHTAGIKTVEALLVRSINEVSVKSGITIEELKDIYNEAYRLKGFWLTPADKIEDVRGPPILLTTGSKELDRITGGGIRSREITELAGDFGAGKTQIAMTVIVEALGQKKERSAIVIDTEDTFRRERLAGIAEKRGYDPKDILKRTLVIHVNDSEYFMETLDLLDDTITALNVSLIVVDSIIAPLRAEYVGREILWLRQQILNKFLRRLLNLAKVYNLAVVVTNQVVTSPQATYTFDLISQKPPTGGPILAHNANTRLYLRKAEGSLRIARLIDSSWLPEQECRFRISEKGIEDVE